MQAVQGLTEAEARARRERGEGNNVGMPAGRSYWDIIRSNLFNFFNNILYAIGIALIALGQYNDAITSVWQGLVNAIIGTVQELNAKRKLDQIALLTRTMVTVIRDGREQAIDPAGLVRGDCVRVQAGDQIMVDGRVVGDGRLEIDESLLTGEPDLAPKQAGDTLLSGSFCVTGDAYYEAEKVGRDSFTVGLPTLFLTLWARPETPQPDLLRRLMRFVLPAAIVTTIFGVAIYTYFYTIVLKGVSMYIIPADAVARWEAYTGLTYKVDQGFGAAAATIVAQTALSTFASFAAFGLILFLEPPFRFFTGWTTQSPDKRPALLALGLGLVYIVVLVTPVFANYFGLVTPGGPERQVMLVTLPLWFLSLRTTWRTKLFERFLAV